ncbi:fumarylacetoacetate hydrolase family protein [Jiulongibacter sediminis]|uniref:2-hydroxyhepta-2,4-diene-1,7-dioate isomerase n=1 Tax=Jiulongibacter sediminis TaxID=1605367 RepID=A0A0P7C7K0_9BACT|nr:fumarylacetoacetate hydrolase family protein [Jiulongibacter sediminis]KPM49534.1 2-hydroxyhepta-2,4-diene-1,7-dioate isomerase [Jiulongibacter sediminis]TBX26576.1 2-hydroxyhepta-2,4-diene-1,7-dioate isomerase [Jiulongibacter sediminis]
MKIIAVGRNYVAHIEELKNDVPTEPVIFTKPDTAVLRGNEPFYYPSISNSIHHELEVVLKINKVGKNIEEKFAHKYYDEIGLGIDFTARDIQTRLKEQGLPWDLAKGFNGSAPISDFVSKEKFDLSNMNFDLKVNNELRQKGNTGLMIYTFDYLISFVSKFFTLKTGDLLFTGTPAGVAEVKIGDRLQASLEGNVMLDFEVK